MTDRRIGRRCRSAVAHRTAELRSAWRTAKVTIENESAGGYGINLDRSNNPFRLGQELTLLTETGASQVRMVYSSKLSSGWRIGLQRLDEVDSPSAGKGLSHISLLLVVALVCWYLWRQSLGI